MKRPHPKLSDAARIKKLNEWDAHEASLDGEELLLVNTYSNMLLTKIEGAREFRETLSTCSHSRGIHWKDVSHPPHTPYFPLTHDI
jgi:hypothetical protein